jgi:hypothetical protein
MALQIIGLFCEDVREEKSGQLSLIGLMSDNINVEAVNPGKTGHALFPKIGLFVRINMSVDEPVQAMSIKLLLPNGQKVVLGEISENLIQHSKDQAARSELPLAGIRHHAVIHGFAVPQSGAVLAVVEMGEQQFTCAVLNIKLGRDPNASAPPASQSPPAAPQS